ncbi:hypothetical protein R3P38DRAFT_3353573 [Favolaschia claudopus]|uniref:Uncharacterized protein n=1 Tax=Favolaschia claudopus TaxID=2862362 RepID=A0AAW0BTZ3_9AGAR
MAKQKATIALAKSLSNRTVELELASLVVRSNVNGVLALSLMPFPAACRTKKIPRHSPALVSGDGEQKFPTLGSPASRAGNLFRHLRETVAEAFHLRAAEFTMDSFVFHQGFRPLETVAETIVFTNGFRQVETSAEPLSFQDEFLALRVDHVSAAKPGQAIWTASRPKPSGRGRYTSPDCERRFAPQRVRRCTPAISRRKEGRREREKEDTNLTSGVASGRGSWGAKVETKKGPQERPAFEVGATRDWAWKSAWPRKAGQPRSTWEAGGARNLSHVEGAGWKSGTSRMRIFEWKSRRSNATKSGF